MLDSETIACLRQVLDEVCKGVPLQETGTRAHVASKILEAASRGETSVEVLKQIGRKALAGAPSMWPERGSRRQSTGGSGSGDPTKQDQGR